LAPIPAIAASRVSVADRPRG